MRTLRTIPAIVKAFDGEKGLAALMEGAPLPNNRDAKKNASVRMILNWLAEGYIPPGWHYRLHLAAEARGYWIDPRALGVPAAGFGNVYMPARSVA